MVVYALDQKDGDDKKQPFQIEIRASVDQLINFDRLVNTGLGSLEVDSVKLTLSYYGDRALLMSKGSHP